MSYVYVLWIYYAAAQTPVAWHATLADCEKEKAVVRADATASTQKPGLSCIKSLAKVP